MPVRLPALFCPVGDRQASGSLPDLHTALFKGGDLGEELAVALILRGHPPVA